MKIILNFVLLFTAIFFISSSLCASDKNVSSKQNIVLFENLNAKKGPASATISWSLNYDALDSLQKLGYQIKLKYNTEIRAKRDKSGYADNDWFSVKNIPLKSTKYDLEKLDQGTTYLYQISVIKGQNEISSEIQVLETEYSWGLFNFLVIVGALGMFIYGMKIMSEGLQQAAGSKVRNLLGSLTSNRFKGVLTGFGTTSIVQSSSVTTVMTVSFVNAGLMTLTQSAGVMMGANIGTTITGWLINWFGFSLNLGSYALIFIAIGAPFLFLGKSKLKAWANAIIGFALLFMGLSELAGAVPELNPDSAFVKFFMNYKDIPVFSTLLFVLLGTLITVIIQSSSAAMALTMTLVASGLIPFEVAAAMILGENIGTTVTAELAATIGNVYAKRSARIHSLFNIIGVTWAVIIFPYFLQGIAWFMDVLHLGDPFSDPKMAANTGLAMFHSCFNLLNVMLLIAFVPQLVKLASFTVRSKGAEDEVYHLDYIGTGILSTPELSLLEAKKEIAKFGEITSKMSVLTRELLYATSEKEKKLLMDKIAKYEDITDNIEIEVANYLNKLSENELTEETAMRIRAMNSTVNDLERVGDIFYQMSKSLERKDEQKIWFDPEQRKNLSTMFDRVDEAFKVMCKNLIAHAHTVTLDVAQEKENQINILRDQLRAQYFSELSENKEFNVKGGMVYHDLFSSLEKVGDHIINVTESVVGKI